MVDTKVVEDPSVGRPPLRRNTRNSADELLAQSAKANVGPDLDREPGPQRSACPERHHRAVDALLALLLTTTLLGLVAGLI